MNSIVSASNADNYDQPKSKRLLSIDLWRGLVMVLMALDHVRSFFTNVRFSPLDITQTTIPLFFTRWVTHLCAPSFVFLAGIAAYLSLQRYKNKRELSRFLFTRGLWLVFLELTVISLAWTFNPTFFGAGVLWVIGWSMVVLAVLIHLPSRAIATFGILLIVGHNLFDNLHVEQLGRWGWLWAVLHEQQMFTPFPGIRFFIVYPLIPWMGVMAVGYAFGRVFNLEKSQRSQLLQHLGLSLILSFIILRAINIYGDPKPWSFQPTFSRTLLSFINCHKYPPSLLFLLITLGISILIFHLFENHRFRILKPLALFGRVPLFFYIIHLWLIHIAAILLAFPNYGWKAIIQPYIISRLMPPDYGYDLPKIYILWLIILVILYPICNWFADYKAKHQSWWLNYL
ncbi:hypothetical protein CEN50_11300 [Fischerella thermalis CCMEE 5268]|uniref:Heparan-alpha-glucosaminide N-acetyltransferase catalytic domain-containing protein n=1 Tax=Fischerella thermalis CCMEE 5268 TaxID=2019662 RepID=A0A2N6KGM0_9CYAN|nr:heparan-alpha-glucosaminide N-acetyltransferase domain-containing protein [Fischerella thermalis]PLZ98433.1 hypothetical protein CEN50_11300 [Fischerella thermalis CCMEE 5268]